MSALGALMKRDMVLAWRGQGAGLAVAFFFLAITLVPFGIGPDLQLLQKLSTGLVWVSLILAMLLSLENMFQADMEDGSFDQLMLGGVPLELICLVKALAHWLAIGVPLVAFAPLAGLLLNISPDDLLALGVTLLAGSPALSLLGMVGSALAVSVRRGGLLGALLVMPLYVPVLIFGSTAFARALDGELLSVELFILILFGLAAAFLSPLAGAAALRVSLR